ncbi:MAG: hypothetical protein QOH84_1276, partial [Kribbellaceae bacterium]|nr:hypothetical protein [Kribbellaceae bacterium]
DIVNLPDGATALTAVREGTIDATFRALGSALLDRGDSATSNRRGDSATSNRRGDGAASDGRGAWSGGDLDSARVFDEPLQLLTGPAHPHANARSLSPSDLRGQSIWMPGNIAGTEWAAYYDELAATFGFSIDATGPNFGLDAMLDAMAEQPDRATFVGEQTRFRWPDTYDLRRIDLHNPTPVYPHSLIWRTTNPHPALTTLRTHLLHHHQAGRRVPLDRTWSTAPSAP